MLMIALPIRHERQQWPNLGLPRLSSAHVNVRSSSISQVRIRAFLGQRESLVSNLPFYAASFPTSLNNCDGITTVLLHTRLCMRLAEERTVGTLCRWRAHARLRSDERQSQPTRNSCPDVRAQRNCSNAVRNLDRSNSGRSPSKSSPTSMGQGNRRPCGANLRSIEAYLEALGN